MTDLLPVIAAELASIGKIHVRCSCETKSFWPWKREIKCRRCKALEAFDAHRSIVQTPGVKP
jgi:hypothetical protein